MRLSIIKRVIILLSMLVFPLTNVLSQEKIIEILKIDPLNFFDVNDTLCSMEESDTIAKNYLIKAIESERNSDFEKGERYYLKAIDRDNKYIEAYIKLANLYKKLKLYDKAIAYYKNSCNSQKIIKLIVILALKTK